MMTQNDFISIDGLTKSFSEGDRPALDNLNVSFQSGKMIGLVGPDGAGKTTLLRLMAGLLTPTKGSVTIGGLDATSNSEAIHEIIGYMPERFGLYEDLTVQENLNLYADLHGLPYSDRDKEFEKLLTFAGLTSFPNRLAGNLSGGMKQKLGLICSLLRKPPLLLLDEPSAGVDPKSRRELWKMTTALLKENTTVVWSTSYLDEAEKCEEVLLLHEGKLIHKGSPHTFTTPLEGRSYELLGITSDKRAALTHVLEHPAFFDGIIQGDVIRALLKEGKTLPSPEEVSKSNGAHWKQVPPRFEDAYVEALGGSSSQFSQLAKDYSQIPETHKKMIDADGLTKKFGDFTAVNEISFHIEQGEIFALLGPNGAGKSTTFKMLCGLLKPTAGICTVQGVSMREAPSDARGKIGYMAQKFSLYTNMSVRQNLDFFAGVYPVPSEKVSHVTNVAIEIFDLTDYSDTPSGELPIGFQKRLSLAAAVMHKPPILFLDEPTSGVDPVTRREFWNHINGLIVRGVTVMVTTHFMDEAEYCDRIAIISKGTIVTIGSPDELKRKVISEENPHPTLEDAFILLSEEVRV